MEYPYFSQDGSNHQSSGVSRSESWAASSNSSETGPRASRSPRNPTHPTHPNTPMPYEMSQFNVTQRSTYTTTSTAEETSMGTIPLEFIDYSTGSSGPEDKRSRDGRTRDEHLNTTNMNLRRRAQNRASQRAFRERKEKHVQDLEEHLHHLQQRHDSLLQSYSQQAIKVSELNERIERLTLEITHLRSSHNETSTSSTPFVGESSGPSLPEDFEYGSYPDLQFTGEEAYYEEFESLNQSTESTSFPPMNQWL